MAILCVISIFLWGIKTPCAVVGSAVTLLVCCLLSGVNVSCGVFPVLSEKEKTCSACQADTFESTVDHFCQSDFGQFNRSSHA